MENLKLAFDATFPCTLSLRVDQPDGVEIGSLKLQPATKPAESRNITATISKWTEQELKIKPLSGKHTLYLVATNMPTGATGNSYLSLNTINFLPAKGNSQ